VSADSCETYLLTPEGDAITTGDDDTLLAFAGGDTAVLELVRVTAHIDLAGRDVVGLAPVGAPVSIEFKGREGAPAPANASTGPDDAGVYDYELTAAQWALLQPGLVAETMHALATGHRLFARGVIELIRVSTAEPAVEGFIEPLSPLTVTLTTQDETVAVPARSDALGAFRAELGLRSGSEGAEPRVPAPGDRVVVEHARGRHEAVVGSLHAWLLGSDLALSGSAPSDAALVAAYGVGAEEGPSFGGASVVGVAGRTDPRGAFFTLGPMLDRSRIAFAELRASHPGGIEQVAVVDFEREWRRAILPAARTATR
jgi:hypothetical protein